jgi:hypothetical protein
MFQVDRVDRSAASADHQYRKNPGCPRMLLLRIHPARWNQKCCLSTRFLEPSNFFLRLSWPARGCVRRLPTRASSVCNTLASLLSLFTYALFLATGAGEPDPSSHASPANPTCGCSRAFLVALNKAGQLRRFRVWLGSRIGSAAFIAGVLVAGQGAAVWGLSGAARRSELEQLGHPEWGVLSTPGSSFRISVSPGCGVSVPPGAEKS